MRLARLVERAVSSMSIDLSGLRVLTEAATGAYAVTPVIAALAGAVHVDAVTCSTRFGSADRARDETIELADLLGVGDRIQVLKVEELSGLVPRADVVTNSGHVRPIDAALIGLMKPSCVVPLMFETWEIDLGRKDVDLDGLRSRGIRHAGTNERHPAVDTFSYLGTMAVRLFGDAGIAVYGSRLLVLCDNPFDPYLGRGLKSAGADVSITDRFDPGLLDPRPGSGGRGAQTPGLGGPRPRPAPRTTRQCPWRGRRSISGAMWREPTPWRSASRWRRPKPRVGVTWPCCRRAVGPEPIVRLQAGGLKVASVLRRADSARSAAEREFLDEPG